MCGFFISNDPIVNNKHHSIIEELLRFRGPDASSELVECNTWKAYHSRLSIIDIETQMNQPVINDDGSLLVFNGEILNYKELGLQYFNKEYTSDTLLLNDLCKNNKLKLSELDGFYAFVFIGEDGSLTNAARDRFGVKPLFYHKRGGYISFSSEPSVLKSIFNLETNPVAIDEYLTTRAPIFSNSYFKDVNVIEPGHCMIQGTYFDLNSYLSNGYHELDLNHIEKALKKGVETREVADVPVGLLLSRGIDSHLLKALTKTEHYYSIGFDGDEDYKFLEEKKYDGLKLIKSDYESYRNDLDFLLNLRKEPMSVPNEVLLYQVAKVAAKDGVKVLLSGEGADEFFGGYDRVYRWASQVNEFDLDGFLKLYCYQLPAKDSDIYKKFKEIFTNVENLSPFEKVRWFFIKFHMPVLFRRLDFSLMAAGVEGREPLANQHTFLASSILCSDVLMNKDIGKIPLRDIAEKYYGRDFAFEKKVGFPVDLCSIYPEYNNRSSYQIWFEKNLEILKK